MKIGTDQAGSPRLVLVLFASLLLVPGSGSAEPSGQPWLQLAQTDKQQPEEKAEPEEERRKQKQDRARRSEDDQGQAAKQRGRGRAEERKRQGSGRAEEDNQEQDRGRAEQKQREDRARADQEKQKQDRVRAEQEQKQREDRPRADREKQEQDPVRAEQKQGEDRARADQEKQKQDRVRAEQEQKRGEDRARADQEKQEQDRVRAEQEQKRGEDRPRADQEKQKQDRAGAEQRQVEQERARLEAERQKQKEERARLERERSRGAKEATQERERRLQAEEDRLRAAEEQLKRREDRFREDRRPERAERRPERLEDVQKQRRERVEADGKRTIIEEPDRRVIVRENGRAFIRHDETDRLARQSRDTRVDRRRDGITLNVFVRPGGVEVISELDEDGRLLRRYRRDRSGREIVLIDNREFFRNRGRRGDYDVFVELPPPRIEIPRRKYIVDYSEASREDIYEALTAPPVERIERRYSLEEVRRSHDLRERMRRVDLDDINFEFGSWEVTSDQLPKLERLARVINSILDRRPSEVFLIEGHTDAVGSDEDNLSLSDRRAEAVAIILSDRYDVLPENLTTQGYGEQYLKVDTQEAERLNRRVAVRRITPLLSRNEQEGRLDRRR